MPHRNLHHEIDFPGGQPESGEDFYLDDLAEGANEGLSAESTEKDFGLIPFEKQVIALTVAGYSSDESAERMGISEPALRLHLKSICDKLRVSDQLELILFAIYHHVIDTCEVSSPCNRGSLLPVEQPGGKDSIGRGDHNGCHPFGNWA